MIQSVDISHIVIGPFTISVYGALIGLGFLIAYGVTIFLARRTTLIAEAHIDPALLWIMIQAIASARALFVLYHLDYFFIHPEEIVAVWRGGWVFHGALAGGILGLWAYCKRSGLSLLAILDLIAPGVALGQAIGRWGNFFNQEAYGLPTDVPWALTIDPSRRLPGYEQFATFHPTFLYESIVDVGLFVLLSAVLLKWRNVHGGIFFLYLLLYSLGRFGIEFLRIDLVPVFASLRAPQWISLGFAVIGCFGLWHLHKQKKVIY